MASKHRETMETMLEAIERLEGQGYDASVRALPGGQLAMRPSSGGTGSSLPAEDFDVEQIVRFEGASDPGDESVIFALRAPDGVKGLFVATYGPQMEAESVAVVERLDADASDRKNAS